MISLNDTKYEPIVVPREFMLMDIKPMKLTTTAYGKYVRYLSNLTNLADGIGYSLTNQRLTNINAATSVS